MYDQDLNSVFLRKVQTDATLLANNSKHCWIKNATYYVRLNTLLHVVACCWELKPPVKLLAGPLQRNTTLLGVVASVITYNCSFKCKNWIFYRTDYGVKVNSHY